jgi:pimeloyl-ACP methyl ester carboxylesterase
MSRGLDAVWGCRPTHEEMSEVMQLFAYDKSKITDELVALRTAAFARPEVARAWAEMFAAPRQRWLDALAREEDEIRDVRQEVLVVHGREDEVIPVSGSHKLAALLPPNDLHEFGRCGHWVQIEAAARFVRLVADLLHRGL